MSDFDHNLAPEYSCNKACHPTNVYVDIPSILEHFSKISGLDVLDIGCGDGGYSRKIAALGAKVVAVDNSVEMIEIAASMEKECAYKVEYIVDDFRQLQYCNKFDYVLANFVLQFCDSVEILQESCRKIYSFLKPGGKALGLVPNGDPILREKGYFPGKYGWEIEIPKNVRDGQKVRTNFYAQNGKKIGSTDESRWFFRETYENAFRSVFPRFNWRQIGVSQGGVAQYGADFWSNYLDPPKSIMFEAQK